MLFVTHRLKGEWRLLAINTFTCKSLEFLKDKKMLVHDEQKICFFGFFDPKASGFAVVLVFDDVFFKRKAYM